MANVKSYSNLLAPKFTGNLEGNASTASKLSTKIKITISGVTATAQDFDGSANITIPITAVPSTLITGSIPSATKATQDGNGNVISSTYFKTTGGTLTTSQYNGLTVKRSDTNGSSILLANSSGNLGMVGFNGSGDFIMTNKSGTAGTANMLKISSAGILSTYNDVYVNGKGTYPFQVFGSTSEESLLVVNTNGNLTTKGTVNGYTLAAACARGVKTLSSKSHSGYGTNNNYVPDISFVSYWNGAYDNANASNLTYCHKGTIVGSSDASATNIRVMSTSTYNSSSSSLPNGTIVAVY